MASLPRQRLFPPPLWRLSVLMAAHQALLSPRCPAPEASSKRPKEDDSTETAPAETTDGEAEVKQVVAPAGDKPVASATSTASTSAFGKISSLGQAVFGKPSSSTLPAFGKASSVGSAWTKTKLGSGSSTGFGSTSKGMLLGCANTVAARAHCHLEQAIC